MGMRPLARMVLSLVILLLVAAPAWPGESPVRGGTLRFAMIDTPPSLDAHILTATLSTTISQHFLETLFTFTENYEPVPHLAKSAEVRDGGKLILIQLRQGVLFHNGKEMTSDDVVASLNRWGKFGARAPALFQHVEQVAADGKYGVRIQMKNPFAPWATLLAYANGGPTIFPKEVMENATKQPIAPSGYIGTGPYRFVEWKAGHEIILERFDKYVKRTEKSDGYAGERVAYFDKLVFVPVADPGTRVNGLKAGEYDYSEYIPGDLFEGLEKDATVATMIRKAAGFGVLFFNQKEGLMTNLKLRQALLAATNMEPVLSASVGPKNLWATNGAMMSPGTKWYTKVGLEAYSQSSAAKAKALAKEAGYKGETIRYMVTTSYADHYSASVVIAKQLKDAGFNIDLQIYDWATLVSRRAQPGLWDVFYTTHGFVPDPILFTYMSPVYPGWWNSQAKQQYTTEFTTTQDSAKRMAALEKLQALFYQEVPVLRTGDTFTYDIYNPKLQGITASTLLGFPSFWNVWKK
jgi:peptide/nickel transport system substrate-binding protein